MSRNIQNLESVVQLQAGVQLGMGAGIEVASRHSSLKHLYLGKRPSDPASSGRWCRTTCGTRAEAGLFSDSRSERSVRHPATDTLAAMPSMPGDPPAGIWARLIVAASLCPSAAV